ncbi:MAG: c-type cytochrome [Nitrospiria bacterium]
MRGENKRGIGFILFLALSVWTAGWVPIRGPVEAIAAEDETEDAFTGDPVAGQKLMRELDCYQCHGIGDEGGDVGPDLTNVRLRRSKEWLFQWLEDPSLSRPSTGMPAFEWKSDEEIYNIIAYLDTLKTPVDTETILKEKDLVKAGEMLVKAYDCRACHTIKTGGRDIYPNLTKAGEKLRPEWDKKFLKDPSAWDIYTFMPNFHLSDPEIEAIVSYILSEK